MKTSAARSYAGDSSGEGSGDPVAELDGVVSVPRGSGSRGLCGVADKRRRRVSRGEMGAMAFERPTSSELSSSGIEVWIVGESGGCWRI